MTLFSKYLITVIAAITATLTGVNAHADVTTLTFEIVNAMGQQHKLIAETALNLALAAIEEQNYVPGRRALRESTTLDGEKPDNGRQLFVWLFW